MHLSVKPDDTDVGYVWLALEKMHLYHSDGSEGGMGTLLMFMTIAILILIIACINYVNLSTARSMLSSKDVSLRKSVGRENSSCSCSLLLKQHYFSYLQPSSR
jgi:putative ABC transport system permease protein